MKTQEWGSGLRRALLLHTALRAAVLAVLLRDVLMDAVYLVR